LNAAINNVLHSVSI